MYDDLTAYERDLAERFRSSLLDNYEEYGEGLIDPSHPEYPAVLAIAFPPRKRRSKKIKAQPDLKQEHFNA